MSARDKAVERELKEIKAVIVLVILTLMLFAIAQAIGWFGTLDALDAFPEMAHMLFGEYIVPFEVLGFLLLAALLGAIHLAAREATRRV